MPPNTQEEHEKYRGNQKTGNTPLHNTLGTKESVVKKNGLFIVKLGFFYFWLNWQCMHSLFCHFLLGMRSLVGKFKSYDKP
jgi:hypothetical protein